MVFPRTTNLTNLTGTQHGCFPVIPHVTDTPWHLHLTHCPSLTKQTHTRSSQKRFPMCQVVYHVFTLLLIFTIDANRAKEPRSSLTRGQECAKRRHTSSNTVLIYSLSMSAFSFCSNEIRQGLGCSQGSCVVFLRVCDHLPSPKAESSTKNKTWHKKYIRFRQISDPYLSNKSHAVKCGLCRGSNNA